MAMIMRGRWTRNMRSSGISTISPRKYYLLGRDRLIRNLDVPAGGSVLEVGSGHRAQSGAGGAALSRGAAVRLRYFGRDAQVGGKDARRTGDARPAPTHAVSIRNGFSVRRGFDRVYVSYSLSMIPDWEAALEQVLSVVAPGGSLHIVRFRPAGGIAALVPQHAARLAGEIPCDAARGPVRGGRRGRRRLLAPKAHAARSIAAMPGTS